MNPKTESKIRRLTSNQARVLKAIVFPLNTTGSVVSGVYVSTASGLRGNELGGTVSALERSGTIQPFGREERQFNWELIDPDLKQAKRDDPKALQQLLKRLAGENKK